VGGASGRDRNKIRRSFRELAAAPFIRRGCYILHHQVSSSKKPVLDEDIREIIVSALAFAVQEHRIYMRAFVVMLDHWHALFALCDPWTLPRFMHMLMSFIGAKTSGQLKSHNTFWQDGYYDTRVRTAKQFAFVANYIEQNPVTKGLAGKSEEWHASSAKRTELITAPWPWMLDGE
jgi:REP element-mobilizing transposase RayT